MFNSNFRVRVYKCINKPADSICEVYICDECVSDNKHSIIVKGLKPNANGELFFTTCGLHSELTKSEEN